LEGPSRGPPSRIEEFIPRKKIGSRRNPPWIDHKTLKLIKKRDRIHKKLKKTGRADLDVAFRKLKHQVQQSLCRQYWKYVEDLITEDCADQPHANKKFWSFIKLKQNENSGVSPLTVAGKLVTDDRQKAEILNEQFQSAFTSREEFSVSEFEERCPMPPVDPNRPKLENINITVPGVEKLLKNLDPTKACGPDNLSPRVLKEVAVELAPALTFLFQASICSGVLPSVWKTANVSPVFKKGERYKAENYRPISLTCIPCKLLEHIVVSAVLDHCELHDILCTEQHGFRREGLVRRSCWASLMKRQWRWSAVVSRTF
jgi:hypothetical protein